MTPNPLIIVFDGQQRVSEKLQSAARDLVLPWSFQQFDNIDSALLLLESQEHLLQKPHLIVVDASLPNMAAFDFLYCAKKHPFYKEVPIVLLGDEGNEYKRHICYHFQGNAFCKTPNSPEAFQSFVESLRDFWMINSIPQVS